MRFFILFEVWNKLLEIWSKKSDIDEFFNILQLVHCKGEVNKISDIIEFLVSVQSVHFNSKVKLLISLSF